VRDKDPREPMEASENAGLPRPGRGGPDLQRIDPARIRRTLRDPASDRGYERLALMLDTILPRLIGEADPGRTA
jgi:hypothetical protein